MVKEVYLLFILVVTFGQLPKISVIHTKILRELQMLSSVTLNCQITKIVMNSASQLSEMQSVSHMSQVTRIAL